jgi:GNAT superfamily N-acetyltransferase
MGEIHLSSEVDARPEDVAAIETAIDEFNMRYTGDRNYRPVRIFLRDEANALCGGITADLWGGWMHITYLWIEEALRGQDYGTRLIEAAEDEARTHGCHHVQVETFSFQAPSFYQRLGYEIIATLDDYPVGEPHFTLTKRL